MDVAWFNRRENQLLVHSYLYYQRNTNIIDDYTFDRWSKELADAIQKYPEVFKQSYHYKDFKEFDGSTGAFLPYANPDVQSRGEQLIKYHLMQ